MEEFLNKKIVAISNFKISAETEHESSKYDLILRFNGGANIHNLKKYPFYNNRTDVCILSGWKDGEFGDLSGFKNQKVLFSRPKYQNDLKYRYKDIAVDPSFEEKIKKYTNNISYIPLSVFYLLYDMYGYDHPTTGLISLFYFKYILNTNISGINFFCDDTLYNTFLHLKITGHDIKMEKLIFSTLNIKNIII